MTCSSKRASVCATLLLSLAPLASGQVLFYEGFEYNNGDLSTVSGGVWRDVNTGSDLNADWAVELDSLGYAKNGQTLQTTGGKAAMRYLVDEFGLPIAEFGAIANARDIGQVFDETTRIPGTPGAVVWVSFLHAVSADDGFTRNVLDFLRSGFNDNDLFGTRVGTNFAGDTKYTVEQIAAANINLPVDPSTQTAHADLVVLRFQFGGSVNNTLIDGELSVYLNPDIGGATPANPVATATSTDTDEFWQDFAKLRLLRENPNATGFVDEIRIGNSYTDVTPVVTSGDSEAPTLLAVVSQKVHG